MRKSNTRGKRVVIWILSVFALLAFSTPCFSSTGVILMVSGKVSVKSQGTSCPAKTGAALQPGDAITSQGGQATILLSDGTMQAVKAGGRFVVPSTNSEKTGDGLVSRLMDTIRETTRQGRGPTIKGMVRGKKEIIPIYPYNSVVTRDTLRFEWRQPDGLEDVEISIKSPSPAYQYTFKVPAGRSRARFPEDAPALVPGVRYYWKVTGMVMPDAGSYRSKLRWFAIFGPEKAAGLNREMAKISQMEGIDPASRQILKANLFISHQLYHQAADLLKNAVEKSPDDPGLKELLIGLYLKMGNMEAAEKLK